MPDSCAELYKELAGLKAEVKALKRVDENNIIQTAVKQAVGILKPEVASAVVVAGTALSTANKGLDLAGAAKGLADDAASVASKALGIGGEALGKAGSALGKVISLAGTVASIFTVLATLATIALVVALQQRIDGLESFLDTVAKTAQEALGAALGVKADVRQLSSQVAVLKLELEIAQADIKNLQRVNKQQDEQISAANVAIRELNDEMAKANAAIQKLVAEVNLANAKINQLQTELISFKQEVERRIQAMASLFFSALTSSVKAIYEELDVIGGVAYDALTRANTAVASANKAIAEANTATARANKAVADANAATANANKAIAQAQATAQQIPPVASTANGANAKAGEALRVANDGIRKIFNPKVIEPTITNQIVRVNQTVVAQSLAEAKIQTQRQVEAIRSNIQSQYQAGQAQVQQLRNQVVQLSPTGVQTQVRQINNRLGQVVASQTQTGTITEAKVRDIVAETPIVKTHTQAISTINSRVGELETNKTQVGTRLTNIQTDLANNDVANKNIESKLDALTPAVLGLPAAVGAIVLPRLLTPAQVGTAIRNNVCELTKPNGCLGKPFTSLKNGQDGLLNALNTGANTLQTGLLVRIESIVSRVDLKLGAQMSGGISGGLSRLSSFLGIDRILNLLNFLAVLHNAMMLSNGLKVTLLQTLSSVGNATGLLQTSENENVDLNKVFDTGVEQFFVQIFGVQAVAEFETTWKKYNRIYQAGANVMNAVSSMTNALANAIETTAEYTGKIGNALKAAGAISENAYQWFSEKVNARGSKFMTFSNTVNNVTQFLSVVDEIAETVIEGQEGYTEAVKATKEFKEELAKSDKEKGVENKAIAEQAAKIKENSTKDPTGSDDEGLLSFLTD